MEQEIEKMSTVSLNTIYSKDILPGIRKIPVDQLGTQQTYTQVQAIYNSISAMIGPKSRRLPRLISTTQKWIFGRHRFLYIQQEDRPERKKLV